ncbi:hypothetical protein AB0C12_00485 [Actinoplanes sp. NPDC048967]|uniref:hypothetical protein n=1 Tax=Actinoplanes sp. NPDC048967 TaxID=3155269 RepID=UPI0033DBB452
MPLRRILVLVFAVTAAVAVLSALTGFTGWLPGASGVLALLTVALYSARYVARPVPRWSLTAAAVVLAAASVVTQLHTDPIAAGFSEITAFHEQAAEGRYAEAVLLVIAVAALTVGVLALPQFRRPIRLTAAACVVALVPVAVVAMDAADERDLAPAVDQVALVRHVAPGMLATVLGGLLLVLAVSRADRWFLAPAGALLVQLAAAHAAWGMSGSWYFAESLRGVETSSAFLEPGFRTDVSAAASATLDFEVGAALALMALLAGPALIAAGAARTAGDRATAGGPA